MTRRLICLFFFLFAFALASVRAQGAKANGGELTQQAALRALEIEHLSASQWPGAARAEPRPPGITKSRSARGDRALIIVGLPGDDEHLKSFRELVQTYRKWLTGSLGFADSGVRIVFGAVGEPDLNARPATREVIAKEADSVRAGIAPEGRLWLIIHGHDNERGGHFFLHLPVPDLRDDELAKLFEGITCREEVFWITTAGSGGFLAALSAKGRIVITATTPDQEPNETEFPPRASPRSVVKHSAQLDHDADGKVSIWDLFLRLGTLVEARFAADKRTPTEHALLDDNGDRVGTEGPDQEETPKDTWAAKKKKESRLSPMETSRKKTILPLKILQNALWTDSRCRIQPDEKPRWTRLWRVRKRSNRPSPPTKTSRPWANCGRPESGSGTRSAA